MFAYSDGQPVEVFDVQDNHPQWDETLMASANSAVTLKVAVAGDIPEPDFYSTEWAEMLAAAYEMFVDDPAAANDQFQWVKLRVN